MFKKRFDGKPLAMLSMLLMVVCLSMFAASREGEWTLNPSDFRYDMSLYFSVEPEQFADLDKYEIGAFVGDECRGMARKLDLPEGAAGCMYMRVRSNSSYGEDVEFLLRDRGTGQTYTLKAKDGASFAFEADKMVGIPSTPYVMTPWLTVNVEAGENGSVRVDNGSYAWGSTVEIEAIPDEGYQFSGWSDGVSDNPRQLNVESDINLTANFTICSYNVTFKVDGEVYEVKTVTYGDPVVTPEMPEREGYTFSGWGNVPEKMPAREMEFAGTYDINIYKLKLILDGEVYKEYDTPYGTPLNREDFDGATPPEKEGYTFSGWSDAPATMPAADVELAGSYLVNSYKLTLVLNGKVYEMMTVAYGDTLNLPTPPEVVGMTWGGWNDAPETMPARDLELTGDYKFNGYQLTVNLDGEVYEIKTILYGDPIQLPEMPEREGHTFSGWSEAPATMPAKDVTVEGAYNPNTYVLTLIVDGQVYKKEEILYGTELKIEDPEAKEGYTFSGWGEVLKTMPARDLELEGRYVVNTYTLTLMLDDTVYEMYTIEYGQKLELPEAPEKEGHTFAGWGDVPATMPAAELTLTGTYDVNSYKLTFILDGKVHAEHMVAYGTPLNREDYDGADPEEREGYTFAGWGEVPETMPARDLELTGSYAVNYYRVTLFLNEKEYEVMTFAYGDEIILPTPPEMEGQTWTGWDDVPATMPARDIEIYGDYEFNGYQITLIVDGEVYAMQTLLYGQQIELPAMPEREGYSFSGWSEAPATMPARPLEVVGSYTPNTYMLTLLIDGEVYKQEEVLFGTELNIEDPEAKEGHTFSGWGEVLKTMPARDLEIQGQYVVNTYTLTLMLDGEVYRYHTLAYGQKLELDEAPEKEGYTFAGWGDVPETMPAGELTLTGTYDINTYNVTLYLDGEVFRVYPVTYGTPLNRDDIEGAKPEEREGYTFAGWGEMPETMPAHDLDLTGTYTANTYKVTLVLEGQVYQMLSFAYGEKIVLPDPLEVEGLTWDGWDDVPETMPAFDIWIVGDYEPNGYKLTIKVDGEEYEIKTVFYGDPIQLPEMPEREGYTFSGWGEVPETMPARELEVSGEYVANIYKLTIKVDGEVYKVEDVAYGTELSIPDPEEREGYTFSGWGDILKTMPAYDLEVNGYFNANNYLLTIMVDDEVYSVTSIPYGQAIELPEMDVREGYTFSGWSEAPAEMPAADVTVTGKYNVNYYKLTLYIDDEVYSESILAYGETIVLPDPEAPEGYVFKGWEGEIPQAMPAHDVDIYGKYDVMVGISQIGADNGENTDVFGLDGTVLYRNVRAEDVAKVLAPGVYIINGKKVIVK